jgi:hypothetical protein
MECNAGTLVRAILGNRGIAAGFMEGDSNGKIFYFFAEAALGPHATGTPQSVVRRCICVGPAAGRMQCGV